MTYQRNRKFTDQFAPEIQGIVGSLLVRPATFYQDTKQATDFTVFRGPKSIASRVRRPGYFTMPNRVEFTIRSDLESGTETELAKILNGFCDWMFYGFTYERNQD